MKIFISYRRDDSGDIAGRIRDRLVDEFGSDSVYMDIDSIPIGVDFRKHIDAAVRQCDVLLVVIGTEWLNASDPNGVRRLDDPADFVRLEIEAALRREVPVIPLLVRGSPMPGAASLPPPLQPLAYRQGVPIRRDPDFHPDVTRLIAGIKDHREAREAPVNDVPLSALGRPHPAGGVTRSRLGLNRRSAGTLVVTVGVVVTLAIALTGGRRSAA